MLSRVVLHLKESSESTFVEERAICQLSDGPLHLRKAPVNESCKTATDVRLFRSTKPQRGSATCKGFSSRTQFVQTSELLVESPGIKYEMMQTGEIELP